jgi:hypothetical protein
LLRSLNNVNPQTILLVQLVVLLILAWHCICAGI